MLTFSFNQTLGRKLLGYHPLVTLAFYLPLPAKILILLINHNIRELLALLNENANFPLISIRKKKKNNSENGKEYHTGRSSCPVVEKLHQHIS